MIRAPRRLRAALKVAALMVMLTAIVPTASAQTRTVCGDDEFDTRITGVEHCLLMQRFGASSPRTLVVWLHGDLSRGGPADYHLPLARETAHRFADQRVMSVALVRPGYPTGNGESSGGSHLGRSDHYTRENIDEIAGAIARLRSRFNPGTVVVVGHSGGAAIAAVMLGRHPQVLDAGVLVGCPCDLVEWRVGRRYWGRSENPIRWTTSVRRSARVIAITGARDTNTTSELARIYIDALRARDIEAHLLSLPGEDHDSSIRSPLVQEAIGRLVER